MRRVFGPRFLVDVALIVAAAVAGVLAGLARVWVIAVIWVAWLLVTLAEWSLARTAEGRRARRSGVRGSEPQAPAEADWPEPEREPEPHGASGSEPQAPGPAPTPAPESERADARLEPVPVPPPEPDPDPESEPEPELPPAAVAFARAPELDGPREWNLWDLERIARDRAGADVLRDEERSFLLMYLREFAGPDGRLPADFDALVRDSFGELLGAARS